MFSKKATNIDDIFTVNLTLCSKCQIDGEDFINFCGLLRKHELYQEYLDPEFQGFWVSAILRFSAYLCAQGRLQEFDLLKKVLFFWAQNI